MKSDDVPHPLKDMSRGKSEGKRLQPYRQGGDGIEDRGKWLHHEGNSPRQRFSAMAEAEDEADRK